MSFLYKQRAKVRAARDLGDCYNPGMCLLALPVITDFEFKMPKGDDEAMEYQVQENCLTIYLPAEVDHHNAEEMKRKADKLIDRITLNT